MKYLILSALIALSTSALATNKSVKVILGKDTRVKVTSANSKSVHNSIGLLLIKFGDKQGACTGTIVGSQQVITAAHCLYDSKTQTSADGIIFYPGLMEDYTKNKYPRGPFQGIHYRLAPHYKKSPVAKNDYALITFRENLPTSSVPMKVLSRSSTNLVIAGYPGDKKLGEMWEGKGTREVNFYIFATDQYDVDTYSGQSGSAIRSIENGVNYVVGIHSGGVPNSHNVGHFFTGESLNIIKKWIQSDK